MKKTLFTILITVVGGALALESCSPAEVEGLGEEKDKAKIIFVNAAPNAAADPAGARREIAVYPFYNGVQFNTFPIKFPWSNGYKAFAPGTMVMRFDTAQSQANNPPGPGARVAELSFPTQADQYYSVYALGTAQKVEPILLNDNLALPAPGKATVRIMNFSPDAGPVDVVITGGAAQPITLATNLAYKGVRDFFEIDPGVYTIEIRVAGTTTRIGNARSNIIIDRNSCYSIWTAGFRTLPSPGNTFAGYAFDIRYHANRWSNPL